VKHALPAGCYLASHYVDRQGNVENWHYYYQDGRLELVDEDGTLEVCRFTAEQVDQAQQAMRGSGLLRAASLGAAGIHDSAAFSYLWDLDGQRGSATNAATPAREHEVFSAFEAQLHAIEEAAGCIKIEEDDS
jgi:hypothetical protein